MLAQNWANNEDCFYPVKQSKLLWRIEVGLVLGAARPSSCQSILLMHVLHGAKPTWVSLYLPLMRAQERCF